MLDSAQLAEYNKVRQTADPNLFCHAPFTSLYFEQSGHALACCYNRQHILGTYPDASIEEMWFGRKAQELREVLANNVLPPGCDICHSQFTSRNFGGLLARQFDMHANPPGQPHGMPKVIGFEISNTCNLECRMCSGYYSSSIRENREKLPPLPFPYDDGFVRQLEAFIPHLKQAKFLGGEPFLIDIYFQIWEQIGRLNPDIAVSITTNGSVLHKKAKTVIEGMRAHMIVSIDSLNQKNYEYIRKNARFDKMIEHFHYFLDYTRRKNTGLSIACCPMQQNWWDLPEIVEFANEHEVEVYFNTVTWPPEASLKMMDETELKKVIDFLEYRPLKGNSPMNLQNISRFMDVISQIKSYVGVVPA